MKKLFLAVIFFVLSVCAVFARTPYVDYSPDDPEKIYLFDAIVKVEKNGEIEVTENITLNARHEEIRRGITRDLSNNIIEGPHHFALTMDGKEHPFFTGKEDGYLAVNFGNDDYISKGLHTYSLTYKYRGAINFLKDYDELYWNVTGNDWTFAIDKARVKVIFPEDIKVRKEGISLYTGKKGEKGQNAEQVGNLVFETTKPLNPKEGFTISIPFDKGVILPPSFIKLLHFLIKILPYVRLLIAVIIFILLVVHCADSWYRYGKDPFLPGVTQYDPPKDVSPAFVCYQKRKGSSNMLTCIILDLAIKKHIKIEEKGENITLYREKTDLQGLPEEEKMMMEKLFSSTDICILNKEAGYGLEKVKDSAEKNFTEIYKRFIKGNEKYLKKAMLLFFALCAIPFLGNNIVLFIVFSFFIVFDGICILNKKLGAALEKVKNNIVENFKNTHRKYMTNAVYIGISLFIVLCVICSFLLYYCNGFMIWINMIFGFFIFTTFAMLLQGKFRNAVNLFDYLVFFIIVGLLWFGRKMFICFWGFCVRGYPLDFIVYDIIFVIGAFVVALYFHLIPNLTDEGKEYFEYLKGFEKYIKTAEIHRFEESNPADAEKIFCDYLPYAFAMGLSNEWIKKFTNVISNIDISYNIGDIEKFQRVSTRLDEEISSSMPVHISSVGGGGGGDDSDWGSGSYGGGHSGGGHGGGGGHGR